MLEKNSTNKPSLDFEMTFDENESQPALFTADPVDRIIEDQQPLFQSTECEEIENVTTRNGLQAHIVC